METTYIQFEMPKNEAQVSKDGWVKEALINIIAGILTKIIPNGNPDFDKEIDNVESWLVEFETETGIPEREIGLDKENRVIVKMPFKKNYGYWLDNNLLLPDFKEHFTVSEVTKETFEQHWEKL
ncbi:MAG: hypothetical protein QM710_13795 [Flavobacterium sp.]